MSWHYWFGLMNLFDHVMTVYVFMSFMYLESTAISVKVYKAIYRQVENSLKQLHSVQRHQHTYLLAAGSLEITWKVHTWKFWTHDLTMPCWCCSRNMTDTEIKLQTAEGGLFTQTWRHCNMKVMEGGRWVDEKKHISPIESERVH